MAILLERELSYKVQGAFFDVYNKYGNGLKEKVYEKAVIEVLEIKGVGVMAQVRINIYSVDTGQKLGTYVPDLIAGNKIVIEIKATPFTRKDDLKQQRSYLQVSKYEIAYLVNFGTPKLEFYRSIHTNDRKPFLQKIRENSL